MNGDPRRPTLNLGGIRRDLVGPDRPLRTVEVVETTGSTNADLLARHGAGDDIAGAVLIAERQTAGRGRHGRSWATPARSQIALSIGVDAGGVPASAWGWLPLLTGVAAADAVAATTGIEPRLKWPNDIVVRDAVRDVVRDTDVGERKLGGILTEVAAPDPVIVVGLGLNVSMTADEAPDPRATSLLMLGSTMLDRSALLGSILAELTARIDRWRITRGPDPGLVADYRARSATLGEPVRALLPGGREITGTATGLDDAGRLQIDTGAETVPVSAGDITHLR